MKQYLDLVLSWVGLTRLRPVLNGMRAQKEKIADLERALGFYKQSDNLLWHPIEADDDAPDMRILLVRHKKYQNIRVLVGNFVGEYVWDRNGRTKQKQIIPTGWYVYTPEKSAHIDETDYIISHWAQLVIPEKLGSIGFMVGGRVVARPNGGPVA